MKNFTRRKFTEKKIFMTDKCLIAKRNLLFKILLYVMEELEAERDPI